jgi:hypothetical protein
MPPTLIGQIQLAAYLVSLGQTTVEAIRGFFAADGHDDAALAAIMDEVDQRLQRRS